MNRGIRALSWFLAMGILVLGSTLGTTCKRNQTPSSFTVTFGGSGADLGISVQQTSDSGYVATGITGLLPTHGGNVLLIKTDASGNRIWDKSFGESGDDEGRSVQQTADGGYVIAGWTMLHSASSPGAWLIKTDASGNGVWDRTFGGTGIPLGFSVQQTSDGGYVIAGRITSDSAGHGDAWLIKADASGSKVWDRTFGGTGDDAGCSVQQTSDGGYVVAGWTASFGAGSYDIWVIRTDAVGDAIWSRTFGGTNWDEGSSVRQTSDGGYIITGFTGSYGAGGHDVWLIKTDTSGNKVWDRTFGGTGLDEGNSVQQTSDGGYVIAGVTNSFGAGGSDVWLIKTDLAGNEVWDETFGGTGYDGGKSVQQTFDGGYVVVGWTASYGAGDDDVWLIKTDAEGN
jgi:hypothetical protein